MKNLLVDRDYNTLPASTVHFDPETDLERLPFYPYGYYMDNVDNRGEGQLHAAQLELRRRWRAGLAFNLAYTYAHSDGNAPDTGNSSLGPVMFDPYDIEKDRGPDPNVVKHRLVVNATWDVPVGHGRKHGADMAGWADALFGGWTVSTLVQARSGNNLTPFFSSYYTTSPWNTGKALDGLGTCFAGCWRPDQTHDPNTGGTRDAFYDVTAYAQPADGKLGNAGKGSLRGPGTWVVNFGIYKDIVTQEPLPAAALGPARQRVQPSAVLRVLWRRLLAGGRLHPRRHDRQRHHGQPWSGSDRQPGGLRSRESLQDRFEGHLLAFASGVAPLPGTGADHAVSCLTAGATS